MRAQVLTPYQHVLLEAASWPFQPDLPSICCLLYRIRSAENAYTVQPCARQEARSLPL